jgi:hypothetical protein
MSDVDDRDAPKSITLPEEHEVKSEGARVVNEDLDEPQIEAGQPVDEPFNSEVEAEIEGLLPPPPPARTQNDFSVARWLHI